MWIGAWLRFALLLGVLLATACRGASESPSPAPNSSAPETRAAAERANVTASPPSSAAATTGTTPIPPLPQKVTISYSSISGDFVPLFLAADHGFFTKYGLDADLTFIS